MNYWIYPKQIVKILTVIALLLCVASLVGQFGRYVLGIENNNLITLFNIDAEKNIPSLYSGVQLLLSSLLLSMVAIVKRQTKGSYVKHWYGLSVIFLYLALDEWFAIHETLNPVLHQFIQNSPAARLDILNLIFLITFVVIYTKFVLNLPSRIKLLFIISGVLYVTGAIAIEIIGENFFSYIYHKPRLASQIISTLEEFLEMLGINLFIYAILLHLASLPIRKLSIEVFDESLPVKKTLVCLSKKSLLP
jgi:hypothetical protein